MQTEPLKRGCPLTGGGPISMTQKGFDRCCAAKKLEAAENVESRKNAGWYRGQNFLVSFQYPCLTCAGPPPELTIIDIDQYTKTSQKERLMRSANNTLTDLNSKLFAQLDRLADKDLSGEALASEINRAKAVTDIACQIISVGSLALKAKVAFRANNAPDGKVPAMLEA